MIDFIIWITGVIKNSPIRCAAYFLKYNARRFKSRVNKWTIIASVTRITAKL